MRDQIRESKPMKDDIDGHHYFDSFLKSYSLAPSVDCWVHTGDFGGTLRACLKLFEGHCGPQQGLVIICVLFTIQRRPVALNARDACRDTLL